MTARHLELFGLSDINDIAEGDDLAAIILLGLARQGLALREGDVIAVAQKIISKAEGRAVYLESVIISAEAQALASQTGKDPRLCTLILNETHEIVRQRQGLVIVEDVRGLVLANAGIDASNVSADGRSVLLLPEDPDQSAARLRDGIERASGIAPGIIILDSIGRAWRMGTVGTAIGISGIPALLDLRGKPDMFGRLLESSELGIADELASAASLVMGQADERCPVALIRGFDIVGNQCAGDLQRPRNMDLFR